MKIRIKFEHYVLNSIVCYLPVDSYFWAHSDVLDLLFNYANLQQAQHLLGILCICDSSTNQQ